MGPIGGDVVPPQGAARHDRESSRSPEGGEPLWLVPWGASQPEVRPTHTVSKEGMGNS